MRYSINKQSGKRELDEVIKPGYILGTKQRVMLDIINKAKNYELPVVIISLENISFEKERLSAKNRDIHVTSNDFNTAYAYPTPISLKVEVTIMTKYMTDLYQIYGKLATQFQPAVSYSWFVPQNIETNWVELRNKIEWDGELSLDIRTESKNSDEDKFTGKMNFTIGGWLFPTMNRCIDNLIYSIGTTIVPSEETLSRIYDEISIFRPLVYSVINGDNWNRYNNPREIATAHPMITSIYRSQNINNKTFYYLLDKNRADKLTINQHTQLTINGYNLKNVKVLAIPLNKNNTLEGTEFYSKTYDDFLYPFPDSLEEKFNKVSGYILNITSQTENQLTIDFKTPLIINGEFDIAVVNDVDYDLLSKRKGFILKG